ncbi:MULTISPECIES: pseudouridine synthase [Caloramator]|uniref:Pseudouridine synthase n=1 Tax=Caloramator proteoclasticus DSM 10124 TaxID=1121262 RepID=A0A1M4TBR2_9CLOT|nr:MULTISPECIES: pseudouridine synthase [Caloramator]SHE41828.1 23S rRNA pseudouridine2605 synthase [Caloramator proteoclasticus DSM 10124]
MKERIQKYIARCGIASRRKAEELVLQGKVKVNGKVIKEIVTVDTEFDVIEVNGKVVKPEENKVYIMLNKPTGYITSAKDQFGRKTVVDLVDVKERIFPVGRLDYDTSGLLILTNDGEVANKLMHPSKEIDKVYIAEVEGVPTREEMERFKRGLKIEDYITAPAKIKLLKIRDKTSIVEVIIHEGRNRQVRKMCSAIGHKVLKLKRVRIGSLELGNLKEGEWRYLNSDEIEYLKSL